MIRCCSILAAMLALLASSLLAQTKPASIDPALLALLAEIDKKAAAVSDLTADFKQEKFTALLKKPLVSTGRLFIKSSAMLWDTTAPEPTRMRIDEKEVRLFYPRQKILEIYPIDQRLGSLAASPLPRLDVLRTHFNIERIASDNSSVLQLKLTPIEVTLQEHVDHVLVSLDPAKGLILNAEVTDADGDRTAIEFSNIKTNMNLSDDSVRLDVPKGTRIVHPLEGLGNGTSGNSSK